MNIEFYFISFLAWSFFLQSLSLFNRRSQRQQTSADRQNTEVHFEYCLSRWMHIIRRITAVASVSLGVLCGLNFVSFVHFVVKLPKMKTKPFQSHFKAIQSHFFTPQTTFLGEYRGFSTNLEQHFLCKTKPFLLCKNLIFYTLFFLRQSSTYFEAVSQSRCCEKITAILTISHFMLTISNMLDNMSRQGKYWKSVVSAKVFGKERKWTE